MIGKDVIICSGVHVAEKEMDNFDFLDESISLQGDKRQKIRIGQDI